MFQNAPSIEKLYGKGLRVEYHRFPSSFFCLLVLKKIVGELLNVSMFRVLKNVRDKRVAGVTVFRQVFCVSQGQNIS